MYIPCVHVCTQYMHAHSTCIWKTLWLFTETAICPADFYSVTDNLLPYHDHVKAYMYMYIHHVGHMCRSPPTNVRSPTTTDNT